MIKLVGTYMSPFTRRVAVSARILGIEFEHVSLSTLTDAEEVRKLNPIGRVPVLILEDGTPLIDSGAILDWLDQEAEMARRLVPPMGIERQNVLQMVAWATAAGDKTVAAYYELTRRPEEKIHYPTVDGNVRQVVEAFSMLDRVPGDTWLSPRRFTQADVSAVVFFDFATRVLGDRFESSAFPRLGSLRRFLYGALPVFEETA